MNMSHNQLLCSVFTGEEAICVKSHEMGAFLVAVSRLRSEITRKLSSVHLIALSLADQEVISAQEKEHILNHEEPKGMLLDVLMTKESRDAIVFLTILRETKQLKLASQIDAVNKEVERIVDRNVDGKYHSLSLVQLIH